jgi:hypothetical protein
VARKTLADIDPKLKSVIEDFQALSLVRGEMARDAYELQDDETKKVIDRMVGVMQGYATGYITATVNRTLVPVKVEAEYLGYNLLFLAVEMVKDLAMCNVRIASFTFPPSLCVKCGEYLNPKSEKQAAKTKGKR